MVGLSLHSLVNSLRLAGNCRYDRVKVNTLVFLIPVVVGLNFHSLVFCDRLAGG